MLSRCLSRLEKFDRVLAEYEKQNLASLDPHEAVWLAVGAAEAAVSLADDARAEELIEDAFRTAKRASIGLLTAHCVLSRSAVALCSGEIPLSRQSLVTFRSLEPRLKSLPTEKPYHVSVCNLKIRAKDIMGWHAASDGDLAEQEAHLFEAALLASGSDNRDRYVESHALRNLADLVGMWPAERSRAFLESRLRLFPWSIHTSVAEAKIRSSLKNNARLYGKLHEGLGNATRNAPSLAARFSDLSDSILFGNWESADEFLSELRFCVSVALDIDWTIPSRYIPPLLTLAMLICPFERGLADRTRTMYDEAKSRLPKHFIGRFSKVFSTWEQLSDACVHKAFGRNEQAVKAFNEGRALSQLNRPLTAIAGIECYTLTRKSSDIVAAADFIDTFPTSSFSRRLKRALHNIDAAAPGDFPYLGMYGIPVPGVGSVGAA